MVNIRRLLTRSLPAGLITCLLVCLPLTVSADSADPPVCVTPPETTSFHYPDGASSASFAYNCDTGLFENAHYTYNPLTGVRTALDPIVFVCDPSTRTYSFTTWSYNAPSGSYVARSQTTAQPPAGASVEECPPLPAANPTSGANTTGSGGGSAGLAGLNVPAGTGGTTASNSLNNTGIMNNTNGLLVNNVLNSGAVSGNAVLLGNTTAGNLSSGNADIVATEMNMLQSSNNFGLGGQPITFLTNINGDVNGDFLLDPATLSTIQPTTENTSLNNNLTFNNTTNAALNTTLNLDATSGNATAEANTTAGNVTTGNANAVANIVNTINSAIAAGHSFIGVVNINGNLNGDILLPPDFIDQLIAANVPTVTITAPDSTNTSNTTVNNNATVNNTNTQGITNNVRTTAASGTADVSKNTTAGNVGTGTATTNITAFNLTGSNVIGSNDLLVFVNVLGKWVGLIVNAPPGSSAAELGGGITKNTTVNNSSDINNNTTQTINNNVNVNARSGDASATRNTRVGDVRTGNANAAVNLLNIENSSLSLSGWFGILFINVFGTWNGSFGVNTSAGDPVAAAGAGGGSGSPFVAAGTLPTVFGFVPHSSGGGSFVPFGGAGTSSDDNGSGTSTPNAVLASSTLHRPTSPNLLDSQAAKSTFARTALIIGGFTAAIIISDALHSYRRSRRQAAAAAQAPTPASS